MKKVFFASALAAVVALASCGGGAKEETPADSTNIDTAAAAPVEAPVEAPVDTTTKVDSAAAKTDAPKTDDKGAEKKADDKKKP
ncbi:MAG: hypothetical protein ACK5CY_00230 [Bacteroidia bacterium]|jgi:hypothetical protein